MAEAFVVPNDIETPFDYAEAARSNSREEAEDDTRVTTSPAEVHAYQPDQAAKETKADPKLVVNMTEEDMLRLIIRGNIKANQLTSERGRQFDENRGPLAKGVGFVGDLAHGVVDVAEGTLRGVVDILTFGQAKGR